MQLNSPKLALQHRNRRQHNLLRLDRPDTLNRKKELVGLGLGIEGGFLFVGEPAELGIDGFGPFLVDVLFDPEFGVAEEVVWVVFEADTGSGTPFGMLLPDSLQ